MTILNIDGVSKSFDGFRAINDLNLAIDKGGDAAFEDVACADFHGDFLGQCQLGTAFAV